MIAIKGGTYRIVERIVVPTVGEVALPPGCFVVSALDTYEGAVRLLILEPVGQAALLAEGKRGSI